jgi:uncharacterized protein (TIGR03435 family)
MIAVVAFISIILAVVGALSAQLSPPDSSPTFAVATIKPSPPGAQLSILTRGRRFSTTAASLGDLVAFAYGIHPKQITGGPDWVESDKFDVLAESESESPPNPKQLKPMVQKLIADRFRLSFHRGTKELAVYEILPGRNSPQLNLAKSNSDSNSAAGVGFKGLGAMTVKNATIADFAGFLQRYVMDRPVVDRSGISGRYDFTLDWTPDEFQLSSRAGQSPPSAAGSDAPDLYTAIQQQLGLKLQSAKLPIEVLVVDRVAKPSEN